MYGGYGNSVLDPTELDSAAGFQQVSVLESGGLAQLDWGSPILIGGARVATGADARRRAQMAAAAAAMEAARPPPPFKTTYSA